MTFTPDDHMNPVYCIGCRVHTPRAVSNANRGLCTTCIAKLTPAVVQAAPPVQIAAPVVQPQYQQPMLGHCPQCRSPYLADVPNSVGNSTKNGLISGGCTLLCVGICIWPLAIVGIAMIIIGICLPGRQVTHISRVCQSCGHRWQI